MFRLPGTIIQRLFNGNCDVFTVPVRNLNGNRAIVSRIKRKEFCRMYEANLVDLDGSVSKIRYHEPRYVVKLPIIFEELTSEVERKAWQARRKPKETFNRTIESETVKLDNKNYLKHFIKKK